jgi:hypothetical protein
MWDPYANNIPQSLKGKYKCKGPKKGKYPQYLGLKNNRDITRFLYIEDDIGDPSASSGKNPRKETIIIQRG